jgi:hypothetical protein
MMQNIVRVLSFMLLFGVGAGTLGLWALCDDLVIYYQNKQLLATAEYQLETLRSLNADYDVLLGRLENDPNLLKRIAMITLGTRYEDPNTAYPMARPEQVMVARQALVEKSRSGPNIPAIPSWLVRCSRHNLRKLLFGAGGVLIIISFVCFCIPVRDSMTHRSTTL